MVGSELDDERLRWKIRKLVMSVSSGEEFMSNIVTDDLLVEIFLRLPHGGRSVIQCGTVCKRWFSILSDPQFIRRFIQFHNHNNIKSSFDSPITILFRPVYYANDLFYEKLEIPYEAILSSITNCRNFFPDPDNLCIKASFQDLLLVCPSSYEYAIFNPLTRQQVTLPGPPKGWYKMPAGLVCEPNYNNNNNNKSQFSYKVFLIINITGNENEYVLDAALFCSETGKWSRSTLSCLRTLAPQFSWWDHVFVASNGTLYCQLSGDDLRGFAAFDLFSSGSRTSTTNGSSSRDDRIRFWFLHLPIDFVRGWQAGLEHVCYGVVAGQLRLSQLLKNECEDGKFRFVLKVWELNHDNNNGPVWLLVHQVRLVERCNTNSTFLAAFHPTNGDVIFLLCDCDLYEYKIAEGMYGKLGRFPDTLYPKNVEDKFKRYMRKFTLVHPSWPTLIPTLPSV